LEVCSLLLLLLLLLTFNQLHHLLLLLLGIAHCHRGSPWSLLGVECGEGLPQGPVP
jgi:hypothetical protein